MNIVQPYTVLRTQMRKEQVCNSKAKHFWMSQFRKTMRPNGKQKV